MQLELNPYLNIIEYLWNNQGAYPDADESASTGII